MDNEQNPEDQMPGKKTGAGEFDDLDTDFDSFEDWDDSEATSQVDTTSIEDELEEFSATTIEDDFSDFEEQVLEDQANIQKKKNKGGVLKTLFSLVILCGVAGGAGYVYLNYKDDIMKLVSPPQLGGENVDFTGGLPGQASAPASTDMASSMPAVEPFLPQPTPISDADSMEPPMPGSTDNTTMSQVIDNAPGQLFDPQAAEPNNFGDDMASPFGEATPATTATSIDGPGDISAEQLPEPAPIDMTPPEDMSANIAATEAEEFQKVIENDMETVASAPAIEPTQTLPTATEEPAYQLQEQIVDLSEYTQPVPMAEQSPSQPVQQQTVEQQEVPSPNVDDVEVVDTVDSADVEPEPVVAEVEKVEEAVVSKPKTAVKQKPSQKDIYKAAERNTTVYQFMKKQDLQLARNALSQGRYEDALNLYNQLYADNPNNYDVAMGRALALQYNGKNEQAIAAYNEILSVNPSDRVASRNKEELMSQGYKAGSSSYTAPKASVSKPSGEDTAMARRAVQEAQKGNYNDAIDLIQAALSLNPNNAFHAYNAGIIYDMAGQTNSAVVFYERALELDAVNGLNAKLPRGQIYDRLSVIR